MNNPDGVEIMGTSAILVKDMIKIVKKVGSWQSIKFQKHIKPSDRQVLMNLYFKRLNMIYFKNVLPADDC
jgi:hypothetical protein